ncbi:glutamine cyclotransferase [Nibricoccus aquaticus]|uniref:Glutamine cyclotransferase n=1 Tax=Nibricoccus aquaticus TaxID=2576891 RepID=A0A290QKQ8_9BACT|nr:glutamine cyclotransferase [Nibricoccus aquaticus]
MCLRPSSFGLQPSDLPTLLLALTALLLTPACKPSTPSPASASAPASPAAHYTYTIVATYPHDPEAFTQGLQYIGNNTLLEGTGLPGKSSLRRVDLATGNVLKRVNLPAPYFGEGITVLGDRIYQLTWQHQKGFIYDLTTFAPVGNFAYTGEGWGLTTDGHSLILSDGTATIRFLNPDTFAVTRTIDVTLDGRPIPRLNELEYIEGEIVANIWQTHTIVRIDPATGRVTGVIDLTGILPAAEHRPDTDVLNGIAYDPATKRLFVTGKNWPRLFEIKLLPKS